MKPAKNLVGKSFETISQGSGLKRLEGNPNRLGAELVLVGSKTFTSFEELKSFLDGSHPLRRRRQVEKPVRLVWSPREEIREVYRAEVRSRYGRIRL